MAGDVVVTWERATPQHVDALQVAMRAADVRECNAVGLSSRRALEDGVKSSLSVVACFDGVPAAILGVEPSTRATLLSPSVAGAWMLTSDVVDRFPLTFWRHRHLGLEMLHQHADILWNCVDARHHRALRFLGALGFTIAAPRPLGPHGLPFHHVTHEV